MHCLQLKYRYISSYYLLQINKWKCYCGYDHSSFSVAEHRHMHILSHQHSSSVRLENTRSCSGTETQKYNHTWSFGLVKCSAGWTVGSGTQACVLPLQLAAVALSVVLNSGGKRFKLLELQDNICFFPIPVQALVCHLSLYVCLFFILAVAFSSGVNTYALGGMKADRTTTRRPSSEDRAIALTL